MVADKKGGKQKGGKKGEMKGEKKGDQNEEKQGGKKGWKGEKGEIGEKKVDWSQGSGNSRQEQVSRQRDILVWKTRSKQKS